MIALSSDCLVFKLAGGECVPFSPDMISVELVGGAAQEFDREFVEHAANAVFHYFKYEMGKMTVTVGEFAGALEKVLQGFGGTRLPSVAGGGGQVMESDLRRLALESGAGCDLFFFPRLRRELQRQLEGRPQLLRFSGLRNCVKHLAGARRRTSRCRDLEERVVAFLRECLALETGNAGEISMVVS